jgi:hypothetical protein
MPPTERLDASPATASTASYDMPPLPSGGEGKTAFAVVIAGALMIASFMVYADGLSVENGVWVIATLAVILGEIFCVD